MNYLFQNRLKFSKLLIVNKNLKWKIKYPFYFRDRLLFSFLKCLALILFLNCNLKNDGLVFNQFYICKQLDFYYY